MPPPRLILASASPRRQELLREAGYGFTVEPADIDESAVPPGMRPEELASHLALAKAEAVAGRLAAHGSGDSAKDDVVILAADTVVALADALLGKPDDADHARRMLRQLSGITHSVITGVAILRPRANLRLVRHAISGVHMRPLSDAEVERYVAGGQWQGKAGGYGIQDQDPFVTRTTGSHTNIVGLPMELTTDLLREAGIGSNR